MTNQNQMKWPKVLNVTRHADNSWHGDISFARLPTDEELRALHEFLRVNHEGAVHTFTPAQGPLQSRDDTLRGLAAFFDESEHLVWSNDEIADCLTGMIAAQPPAAPVETKSAIDMIAACYEGLCPDGSSALDFEWARQRGYILPNNGSGKLSPAQCSADRVDAELAKLQDPVAVHINMLSGRIAKPSWANIKHLYPEQFATEPQEVGITRRSERADRAERALKRAGWTYTEGAKEWKPPLGRPSASPEVRETLEFYAEANNYQPGRWVVNGLTRPVLQDGGKLARSALALSRPQRVSESAPGASIPAQRPGE